MEILVIRKYDDHDTTIGDMYINGIPFCVTLEDEYRKVKVSKETRIPAGRYEIKLRKEGGMYGRYLDKFGTDGMLHLQNVPGFSWIYIHIGNDDDDTDGCILVGTNAVRTVSRERQFEQTITTSTPVYKRLHSLVQNAIEDKEDIWITVVDN